MKIRQTQKSWDNAIVKEKEGVVENEAMIMKKVRDEEKIESTKKVEENICGGDDEVFLKEIMSTSTTKGRKNDRDEREQKNVSDDLEKDAVVRNRHAEEEKSRVRKTDDRACAEVILSAHALVTDF